MARKLLFTLEDLDGVLVQTPLIDAVDAEGASIYVGFVPSDMVSAAEKETIIVPRQSAQGRQIVRSLGRITRLLGVRGPLRRLVHGGGAQYTFHFPAGRHASLDSPRVSAGAIIPILGELRQLAQMAEEAFFLPARRGKIRIIASRGSRRTTERKRSA